MRTDLIENYVCCLFDKQESIYFWELLIEKHVKFWLHHGEHCGGIVN